MTQARILDDLARFGPDAADGGVEVSVGEARGMASRLARSHRENFSVLTRLVPEDRTEDFAAVYAFCRTADDLGDEIGDPEKSRLLLQWWRSEIDAAWAGHPGHWVFRALQPTIERFDLDPAPFLDLVSAFEQDQSVTRYRTWDEVIDYCTRSADPVGLLVLRLLEQPTTPEIVERSNAICTGLQLANHWQDIGRDLLERDRLYVPAEMIDIPDFEDQVRTSARRGWADPEFLATSRRLVRACVDRTWPLFEHGASLPAMLDPTAAAVVEVLGGGGTAILRAIEDWNFETVVHRPTIGKVERVQIVLRAWWNLRRARRRSTLGRPES